MLQNNTKEFGCLFSFYSVDKYLRGRLLNSYLILIQCYIMLQTDRSFLQNKLVLLLIASLPLHLISSKILNTKGIHFNKRKSLCFRVSSVVYVTESGRNVLPLTIFPHITVSIHANSQEPRVSVGIGMIYIHLYNSFSIFCY